MDRDVEKRATSAQARRKKRVQLISCDEPLNRPSMTESSSARGLSWSPHARKQGDSMPKLYFTSTMFGVTLLGIVNCGSTASSGGGGDTNDSASAGTGGTHASGSSGATGAGAGGGSTVAGSPGR